jgi:hypothetical protein
LPFEISQIQHKVSHLISSSGKAIKVSDSACSFCPCCIQEQAEERRMVILHAVFVPVVSRSKQKKEGW